MQAVRKDIKVSHILFFPFGLWLDQDNNPAGQPSQSPRWFTIMRRRTPCHIPRDWSWRLYQYDISHSSNICPHSPPFPLSMCSLCHFPHCSAKNILPTIWRLYDNHSNQINSNQFSPSLPVRFNSPARQIERGPCSWVKIPQTSAWPLIIATRNITIFERCNKILFGHFNSFPASLWWKIPAIKLPVSSMNRNGDVIDRSGQSSSQVPACSHARLETRPISDSSLS